MVLVAHWFLAHTFFLAVLSIDIQRLEASDLPPPSWFLGPDDSRKAGPTYQAKPELDPSRGKCTTGNTSVSARFLAAASYLSAQSHAQGPCYYKYQSFAGEFSSPQISKT